MPDVKRYRKKPVECEAIELRAFGDFQRAADWINSNGGKAYTSAGPADSVAGNRVSIITIDGNIADCFVGWYVVKGIEGEFYPCRKDIFEASHECVEAPVKDEARPGSGTTVPHSPSPEGRSGGAAKKVALGGPSD